jgi:hypothetical protein
MASPSTSLIFPALTRDRDCQIAIRFHWREDRFLHEVGLLSTIGFCPLLQSVDGDAAATAWPPSPPLQNLHEQTVNGRPVLMGLGAAGLTHWSASFESVGDKIICHYAARIQQAPGFVGSTYQLMPSAVSKIREKEMSIGFPDQSWFVKLVAKEGSQTSRLTDQKNSQIAVLPPQYTSTFRQTVQWKFAFQPTVNSSIEEVNAESAGGKH